MVRKKLASAVMALSALQAGLVAAMGLGELSLNSALNQPFKAEIRLLKVEDLDPSQIIVRLAPTDDFKRAGIERDFFLTELRFNVELDGRGGGVIKITTREPVIEPYLDFLIEARWPSGRLLRAYTVLLDLPTYADSAPAPVAPASSAALNRGVSASSAPAKKPAPVADSSPRRAPSTAMPPATGDREYRVQHSDTMWEIAAANRPGNAVTVQQTMLAIQRLNPQAFINNNINLVKSGYVLRLPSEADINVDNGTAVQEVAAQNRAWRGGSSAGQAAEVDGPQLDTRSGAESDAGGVSDKGRLSIAAAGESTASRAGDSSGSAAGNAALRDQLASAQENLDRAQRENDEMLSRLDEMERQVATLQRLLTLKEEQLAALQENLAADPASEQAADLAPAAAGETTDFNYAGPSETAADEVQEAQAAAPEPAPKPVAAQPVQPEPGLVARIVDNPLYLGGIGAGVLALVAGGIWLARRRKDDEDLAAVAELNADSDDLAEELEDLDADALAIADEGLSQVEDAELAEPEPEVATPDAPVRAETGDVIAEAEIYVAYGRYQQAIDLLKTAVDQDPERTDVRLKLIEVCLETGDKFGFLEQYQALQARGDEEAISQVKELMSSFDDVSDWLDDVPSTAAVGLAAGLVLDDDIDSGAPDTATAHYEALTDFDEDGRDSEGRKNQDDAAGEVTAGETLALDAELDLGDLDLGDLDAGQASLDSATDELGALDLVLDDDELQTTGADQTPVSPDKVADLEPPAPGSEVPAPRLLDEEAHDEGLDLDLGDDLDLGGMDSDEPLANLDDLDAGLEPAVNLGELELGGQGDSNDGALGEGEFQLDDLELDLGSESGSDGFGEALTDADLGAEPESERPAALVSPDTSATGAGDAAGLDDLDIGFELPDDEPAAPAPAGDEGDFDFLSDADEMATKLDLARAYIDMGDADGARDILDEVLQAGSDPQKQEAQVLLERIQ